VPVCWFLLAVLLCLSDFVGDALGFGDGFKGLGDGFT